MLELLDLRVIRATLRDTCSDEGWLKIGTCDGTISSIQSPFSSSSMIPNVALSSLMNLFVLNVSKFPFELWCKSSVYEVSHHFRRVATSLD